jgi:hypothetical protein
MRMEIRHPGYFYAFSYRMFVFPPNALHHSIVLVEGYLMIYRFSYGLLLIVFVLLLFFFVVLTFFTRFLFWFWELAFAIGVFYSPCVGLYSVARVRAERLTLIG